MVSMMLEFARLMMSIEIVRCPFTRAWLSRSLNVRRTVATSATVTTVSPSLSTGRSRRSCPCSMTLGTLTDMRPRPVSRLPAGISRLLRITVLMSCSFVRP